jgi:hypothetical protein
MFHIADHGCVDAPNGGSYVDFIGRAENLSLHFQHVVELINSRQTSGKRLPLPTASDFSQNVNAIEQVVEIYAKGHVHSISEFSSPACIALLKKSMCGRFSSSNASMCSR